MCHTHCFGLNVTARSAVEPRLNEPLYTDEVLGITKDIPRPSKSKMYGKEPRFNKTSLQRTYFASALALRYMEVPLYKGQRFTTFLSRYIHDHIQKQLFCAGINNLAQPDFSIEIRTFGAMSVCSSTECQKLLSLVNFF